MQLPANINTILTQYTSNLKQRFYANSLAIEVLICLIFLFMLVIECLKLYRHTYEYTDDL